MNNIISIFLLNILLIASCGEKKKPVVEGFQGRAQGTTYSILYVDEKKFEPGDLKEETDRILADFDMSLSIYEDSSILSMVNRNEDVRVDPYFKEAFRKSVEISRLTGGAFDITVGPLVKAWGFGPDERKNITDSKRDSLIRLVGMDKLKIEKDRVVKSIPEVMMDFNAIAQGYSVDVLCEYFDRSGIKNYLVEVGGEVRARGTKLGEKWRIGIDKPEDNNVVPGEKLEAIIRISDESLATSGNYRKFYVENGVKYSHTIDPRTGYPARNNLLSATIIAADCATADGIATACMVMGLEDAISFIESRSEFLAHFIYSDESGNFRTWTSPVLKERVTEMDSE
jgi:thiamine biosynthesis lipoprotein